MTHMTFSAKEALETYSKFEKEVVYSKRNVMTIDDIFLSEEVYDKLDAEKLIYVVVDNVTDEVVAFSTREEAEAYQYEEKSEDQKVLDKVLEGPATDNLDAMKEAFEEAREEVKEEEMKEGNRIFKVLLDEVNEENGRQAGKIIGKILAEARENEEKAARTKPYDGLTEEEIVRTAVAEIIKEEREEDSTEPILGRDNSAERISMRIAYIRTVNNMSVETWEKKYKNY